MAKHQKQTIRQFCEIAKNKLQRTDLRGADLREANLQGANLREADLQGANLQGANLSGTSYTRKTVFFSLLERTDAGFIVYKSFGDHYPPPLKWKIEPHSIIEEFGVDPSDSDCGSGINVATLDWCQQNCREPIWKCLLKYEDCDTLVVPRGSDGKFRCGRVTLVEKIEKVEKTE